MSRFYTFPKSSKFGSIRVALILLFSILLFDSCGISENYRTQGQRGSWTPCLQTSKSSVSHPKHNATSELTTTAGIIKAEQSGLDALNKIEENPNEFTNRMSPSEVVFSNENLKKRDFQYKEEYVKPTAPKSLKRKHLKIGYIPSNSGDDRATWVNVGILLTFLAGALIMGLTGMDIALFLDVLIIQSLIMLGVSFLNEDDSGVYVAFQVISVVALSALGGLALGSIASGDEFAFGMLMEVLGWIVGIALFVVLIVAYVESSS